MYGYQPLLQPYGGHGGNESDPFVFQPVTLLLPCTGQGALVIS